MSFQEMVHGLQIEILQTCSAMRLASMCDAISLEWCEETLRFEFYAIKIEYPPLATSHKVCEPAEYMIVDHVPREAMSFLLQKGLVQPVSVDTASRKYEVYCFTDPRGRTFI